MARLLNETGLVAYRMNVPKPASGHRLLGDRLEAGLVCWG